MVENTENGDKPQYDKKKALRYSVGGAFVCVHGVHRCYLDQAGLGAAMCLTLGGCCIWSIIEWINMEKIVDKANKKKGWTSGDAVDSGHSAEMKSKKGEKTKGSKKDGHHDDRDESDIVISGPANPKSFQKKPDPNNPFAIEEFQQLPSLPPPKGSRPQSMEAKK